MMDANVELTAITKRLVGPSDDPEYHCEMAARDCYDSGDKAKDTASNLVKSCTISDHLTINGHSSASFRITEVSRALMTQITRHRHACFSVRSQRYVDEANFDYVIPHGLSSNDKLEFMIDMATIREMYDKYLKKGWKKEDARAILPNACDTVINMTMSFEGWIHFLRRRMDKHAQIEIREVAYEIYRQLHSRCPKIFNEQTIMAPRKISIDWSQI